MRLACLVEATTWITNVTIEFFPEFFCVFLAQLILRVDRDWRVRQSPSALTRIFIMGRGLWNAGTRMGGKVLRVGWPAIFFFLSSWNKLAGLNAVQTWVNVLSVTHKGISVQMTPLVRLDTDLEWQVIIVQYLLGLSMTWTSYESVVNGVIEVRHIYFKFHN